MLGEYRVIFRRCDYYEVYVSAHDEDEAMETALRKLDSDPDEYLMPDEEELEIYNVEDLED